jgi:hypothetical protein
MMLLLSEARTSHQMGPLLQSLPSLPGNRMVRADPVVEINVCLGT